MYLVSDPVEHSRSSWRDPAWSAQSIRCTGSDQSRLGRSPADSYSQVALSYLVAKSGAELLRARKVVDLGQ